jgi:uncharacterized protein
LQKSVTYSSVSAENSDRPLLLTYPLLLLIYIYRWTLSPFIGNSCRYYPTCSHYAEDALRKYGAWKGSILAVKRVLRCHPWHEGGYDPFE